MGNIISFLPTFIINVGKYIAVVMNSRHLLNVAQMLAKLSQRLWKMLDNFRHRKHRHLWQTTHKCRRRLCRHLSDFCRHLRNDAKSHFSCSERNHFPSCSIRLIFLFSLWDFELTKSHRTSFKSTMN